jgi:hypothetical protein
MKLSDFEDWKEILGTGKRFWGLERILGTGIVFEVGKDLQI